MRFIYGKQDLANGVRGQENCFLLTNGLGGFSSQNLIGGASRNDHALLMACLRAPNLRWSILHRLEERLEAGSAAVHLSSQEFADGSAENGWKHLCFAEVDGLPRWVWQYQGVQVEKQLALEQQHNTLAVRYRVRNDGSQPCTLEVTPWMQFIPKGKSMPRGQSFQLEGSTVRSAGLAMQIQTNGRLCPTELHFQTLYYRYDACDGRTETGRAAANHRIIQTVAPAQQAVLEIVFSLEEQAPSAPEILEGAARQLREWEQQGSFSHPLARQLACASAAFLAQRASTGGQTILAGFPFFEDWGRDTMIALPGCTLSTGRFDQARSILTTFLQYEQDGLMPNLFPEGENAPLYNTVDAALLLINDVWLYARYTGDLDWVRQAWPVLERIVRAYRSGTRFGIRMDTDGLIAAGQGLDQVTWMDVRYQDHLPTPRHGKPVEINAYWYNALRIMEQLAPRIGQASADYGALADQVRQSFRQKFWMEDKGCLRDLVSGTRQDEQIRCNQIWALSLPFTMLEPDQEMQVLRTVQQHLYTPVGLRTLSPQDPDFHPRYGGPQKDRDLAYHQGTVWPFPLGAFYLAYLRVHGFCPEARAQVEDWLLALGPALREGCAGQLPEIYDGETPTASRGCFAQAWSVGELLRVFEALEGPAPVFLQDK